MVGNRGASGRLSVVPWFRGSFQPPHELPSASGWCLDPFGISFFFFPLSNRGMTRGPSERYWVSRLPPASLEPNRSLWDVGNENVADIVPPSSTIASPSACRAHRSCCRCSATTSFGQDAMRTLRGEEAFFFRGGCLGRTSPPDAMPGAMARMRDEHITMPRDPNHLGQASLDVRAGLRMSHEHLRRGPCQASSTMPGNWLGSCWWPRAMATRHVVHAATPSTKVPGPEEAGRLGSPREFLYTAIPSVARR